MTGAATSAARSIATATCWPESRSWRASFIGSRGDQLQLKFLHVGRPYRRTGLGRTLFERAAQRAREMGAKKLYISATPSENTIGFYMRLGCTLASEIDAELFALEPEDIHLECVLA